MDIPSFEELVASATHRRGRLELFDTLEARTTALMVIDMQNAWLLPDGPFAMPHARALVRGINALAAALRERGGQIIWVRHTTADPGAPGDWPNYFAHFIAAARRGPAVQALRVGHAMHALHAELDVRDGDIVLPKYRFSAFAANPIDVEAMLRGRGIESLIVTGVATNVCVESTVRDAMQRDFRMFMPHDLTDAPKPFAHAAGLHNVMQSFADIRASAALIAMLESQ